MTCLIMNHRTLLSIRRLLPRIFPWQSTSTLKMWKGMPQTSTQTSSQNMQGILQRSRTSSSLWTHGKLLVPLSFLTLFCWSLFSVSWGLLGRQEVDRCHSKLKNWGKLNLSQCRNRQCDSFDYACTGDLTRMEWAKSLMISSGDVLLLLIERINAKFNELDLYKQGGMAYLKIVLDEWWNVHHQ